MKYIIKYWVDLEEIAFSVGQKQPISFIWFNLVYNTILCFPSFNGNVIINPIVNINRLTMIIRYNSSHLLNAYHASDMTLSTLHTFSLTTLSEMSLFIHSNDESLKPLND